MVERAEAYAASPTDDELPTESRGAEIAAPRLRDLRLFWNAVYGDGHGLLGFFSEIGKDRDSVRRARSTSCDQAVRTTPPPGWRTRSVHHQSVGERRSTGAVAPPGRTQRARARAPDPVR